MLSLGELTKLTRASEPHQLEAFAFKDRLAAPFFTVKNTNLLYIEVFNLSNLSQAVINAVQMTSSQHHCTWRQMQMSIWATSSISVVMQVVTV